MRTLVVYCHPNPGSLIAAAKDRVLAGLAAAGHDVRLTDLYADGFEPRLTADAGLVAAIRAEVVNNDTAAAT